MGGSERAGWGGRSVGGCCFAMLLAARRAISSSWCPAVPPASPTCFLCTTITAQNRANLVAESALASLPPASLPPLAAIPSARHCYSLLQNKVDLVTEAAALNQHETIQRFIQGTIAEGAPVLPISAQVRAGGRVGAGHSGGRAGHCEALQASAQA